MVTLVKCCSYELTSEYRQDFIHYVNESRDFHLPDHQEFNFKPLYC